MIKIFKFTLFLFFIINILNISTSNENFFSKGLDFYNAKKYEELQEKNKKEKEESTRGRIKV